MAAFYIVLEVIAFIAVIVVPLSGPKRVKKQAAATVSSLAVTEEGYLEQLAGNPAHHLPVH
ncbi:hypothetical protein [Mucilaginibacter dorajii]|uniref:Uncharacterized protein n=1 Tax=Mucilaginibacter dorajii TaxID=692994 RepID=A0ABP7QHF5_9SPHI|nr:hypothetical protein [Mucilaginibacter dorajii]MCS3736169.1 hypothetical protein [Mucilaginibacter dorajii]